MFLDYGNLEIWCVSWAHAYLINYLVIKRHYSLLGAIKKPIKRPAGFYPGNSAYKNITGYQEQMCREEKCLMKTETWTNLLV